MGTRGRGRAHSYQRRELSLGRFSVLEALAIAIGVSVPALVVLLVLIGNFIQAANAQTLSPLTKVAVLDNKASTTGTTTTPTPTRECSTAWRIVTSPNPGPTNNDLSGVGVVSPDDIWAVGSYASGGRTRTLTLHWDGSQWSVVPSPNGNPIQNYLAAVSAISAHDVWAVGYYVANTGNYRTLVEHWDGQQWSVVASPNLGTGSNELHDVSAISTNDVWAVGYSAGIGTLTEHWNGTQWSVVSSPNPPGSYGVALQGVSAISSSDVWAVGKYGGGSSDDSTLVEHWDGTHWSIMPSPNVGSGTN